MEKSAVREAAFNMIYDGQSAMRLDGNEVAHKADQVLVQDAVIRTKPGESEALRNIYGVYIWRGFGLIVTMIFNPCIHPIENLICVHMSSTIPFHTKLDPDICNVRLSPPPISSPCA
jgi:hypothetical protein